MFARRAGLAGLAAAAGIVTLGLVFGCGEETPVAQGLWQEAAVFPHNIYPSGIAVGPDDSPYFPSHDRGVGVVYRFSNGRLEEAYRAPYDESEFEAIGAAGGAVWVGGNRHPEDAPEHTSHVPLIVRYAGGHWEEIGPPEGAGVDRVYGCAPVSRDFCWVTFQGTYVGTALYSYDHGVWRQHLKGVESNFGFGVVATPQGRVFVDNGHGETSFGVTYLVSDDEGAHWAKETVRAPAGRYIGGGGTNIWATADGAFYVVLSSYSGPPFSQVRTDYVDIYRRDDAPAGAGTYEVVFSTPETYEGGYVDVRALAFRSSGAGFGAGSNTGVRYVDGAWQLVRLTGPEGKDAVVNMLAASDAAFWGLGGYWHDNNPAWVLFKTY